MFCLQQKQRLVVSRCITECLLKELQPVVNIYAKGGTQNELPSFSNKKIIVIRLSIVRSAVLCYLNPWSVRDSFNKENMLTHATHSYQTCTFEIKKKANNYPYKFFSWRWQRSQHACFFLVNFSYVWISEVSVWSRGEGGSSQDCQRFDP